MAKYLQAWRSLASLAVEESAAEDFSVEDFSAQDSAAQDSAVEDFSVEDFSVEDSAAQDSAVEDSAAQDSAVEDFSAQDFSVEESAVEESSARDTARSVLPDFDQRQATFGAGGVDHVLDEVGLRLRVLVADTERRGQLLLQRAVPFRRLGMGTHVVP
jgi:hypothetical protein